MALAEQAKKHCIVHCAAKRCLRKSKFIIDYLALVKNSTPYPILIYEDYLKISVLPTLYGLFGIIMQKFNLIFTMSCE